ncbi:hypothetical protein [Streptomyces acidiscabies]|uniref:hypothetical protein n=1 Tax=Streptomyces acidiscabies TaxID=42234 RepID=UPI0038F72A79
MIAAQDSKYAMSEASNIYKVRGSNQYLLPVEVIGSDRPRGEEGAHPLHGSAPSVRSARNAACPRPRIWSAASRGTF